MCCLGPVRILAGARPGRPCAGLACCWAPAGGCNPVTGCFLIPGMPALAGVLMLSKAGKEAQELPVAPRYRQSLQTRVMLVLQRLISLATRCAQA